MNEKQMLQIVERFSRKVDPVEGQVKITRVQNYRQCMSRKSMVTGVRLFWPITRLMEKSTGQDTARTARLFS